MSRKPQPSEASHMTPGSERAQARQESRIDETQSSDGDTRAGMNRREAIQAAAVAVTAAGTGALASGGLQPAAAAAVHQVVQPQLELGNYDVKAFEPHEWELLRRMAVLILPADEHSGSALDAGAPEFIDLLASNNEELLRILTSGMLWLEHEMNDRHGAGFVACSEEQQHEMLGALGRKIEPADPGYSGLVESEEYLGFRDYTTEAWNELAPGVQFFAWVRRLVVDAFYSSPEGVKDVGYVGNEFLRTYEVPQEAIDHALRKSGL